MRVVLHIGTEKTATTTLQDFVYANREVLKLHGVALTDSLDKTNNRKLAAYCMPAGNFDDYFRDRRISTPQQKLAHFEGFREAFVAEARGHASWAHTLFITSEHFHSRLKTLETIGSLKSVLAEVTDEVIVLCWFREQSAVMRSLYSTAVKSGNTVDIASFARRCVPGNTYYNYHQFFARWRTVFGAENLRPEIYAPHLFKEGDIRKSLLQHLLPAPVFAEFDFSAEPANRSLGAIGLELGRVVNRIFERYNPDGTLSETRQALMRLLIASELGSSGRQDPPDAAALHARFAPSNKRFAREFLGQPGNPFPPPVALPGHDAGEIEGLRAFFEAVLDRLRAEGAVAGPALPQQLVELADRVRAEGNHAPSDAEPVLQMFRQALAQAGAPNGGDPLRRVLGRLQRVWSR